MIAAALGYSWYADPPKLVAVELDRSRMWAVARTEDGSAQLLLRKRSRAKPYTYSSRPIYWTLENVVPRGQQRTSDCLLAPAAILSVLEGLECPHAELRVPSAAERRRLEAAVPFSVGELWIWSRDRAWARARQSGHDLHFADVLLHHGRVVWQSRNSRATNDGVCAFAPARAVRALEGIACPSWRALHARRASPRERALLIPAVRRFRRERDVERGLRFFPRTACVSRLDPEWASASAGFADTGTLLFFRRVRHRWEVAFEMTDSVGPHVPTHAIVLSLASCVHYDAGDIRG
jgi:hypothetical protein